MQDKTAATKDPKELDQQLFDTPSTVDFHGEIKTEIQQDKHCVKVDITT